MNGFIRGNIGLKERYLRDGMKNGISVRFSLYSYYQKHSNIISKNQPTQYICMIKQTLLVSYFLSFSQLPLSFAQLILLQEMQSKQIYEGCPLHPQEFLQIVCLQCQTNSLACPVCIDVSHKGHTIISLKKFLASQLPKLFMKKPDHKVLSKGIVDLGSSYQNLFERMRKIIGHQLNELQKNYQVQVEALQQENNVICGVGEKIYTHQNISLIKKKIKNGERVPDSRQFSEKINDLCQKMGSLVSQVTEDVCQIIRSLNSFWQASRQLLLNSRRQFKFVFSSSLKHKALSLQINNWKGRKIINDIYDNSYHIGVVEPPLNPFKNQVKFRVDKTSNKCVWIGVCDLRKIIDRRFTNCYKKGDGGYWIWQAGCKGGAQYFSSLISQSQSLPWNFDIGDVVRIRMIYEKQNKYVQFYKNNAKVFRGKLEKANVYCACVAMGAQNQAVILMDQ